MESKKLLMSDVGTRQEHLSELHDLWSTGLEILLRGTYHTEHEIAQAADLQVALSMLEFHMMHEFNVYIYARVINSLPKDAKEIKDASVLPEEGKEEKS